MGSLSRPRCARGQSCYHVRELRSPQPPTVAQAGAICIKCRAAGYMPEDTPLAQSEAQCSSCRRSVGILEEERGDRLCQQCRAVFRAARVLIRKGIEDESVIMPTLAFAARVAEGVAADFVDVFSQRYSAAGVTCVEQKPVEGIVLLRQKPATVGVERYEGSMLPKRICIRVFLRSAKPERVTELYKKTLLEEEIPADGFSPGRLSWRPERLHLAVIVDTGDDLSSAAAAVLANSAQEWRPSFPPPELFEKLYAALLGAVYRDKSWGVAYALGGSQSGPGRSGRKALLACVAAYVCDHRNPARPFPTELRARTARLLSRHVLAPCGEAELPEGSCDKRDNLLKIVPEVSQDVWRTELLFDEAYCQ
jgi:hypothetical protein